MVSGGYLDLMKKGIKNIQLPEIPGIRESESFIPPNGAKNEQESAQPIKGPTFSNYWARFQIFHQSACKRLLLP